MKIGIIGIPGRWSSEVLKDAIFNRTGFCILMSFDDIYFDLQKGSAFYKDFNLSLLSALVIKKIGQDYSHHLSDRISLLQYLENNGLRIFSRTGPTAAAINRIKNTVRLRSGGIPMPHTVITESVDIAVNTLKKFHTAVFKPIYSTKAKGMKLLEYGLDHQKEIEEFHSNNKIMYIQKFEIFPDKDLGVVFMGGKHIGTYARTRKKGSWNTSTRFGGDYEKEIPCENILNLAYNAQKLFQLDFTCVDIAVTKNGPVVFEVSAFGGFSGLYKASRINAAELYAGYIIDHLRNS